ncbi:hypothetical protein [Desulfosporosinus sp.]|uniref:hypothetical protein n=1 Tax=Desulfosporosinus sp. TaxID=157907 RepID=UPI00230AB020|nr:hypothetical protein [Desulfosporosinus sp.]MDA8221875.1 hypothetical protein [Desulfitobacterium hafniense]
MLEKATSFVMAIIILTGLRRKFNLMSEQQQKTEPHLEAPRSLLMIFNCLDIINWKIIRTTTIAIASKLGLLREYGCVIMNN